MNEKYKILFVCLGNICRSPAAEGVMRRLAEERGAAPRLEIDSAGTYGGHRGELPDPRMRQAAAKRGLDLRHRSRPLTEEDYARYDRIVVMDDMNYEEAHRRAPSREAGERICRMREFFRRHRDRSYVPDPYYEGREGFELVLDLLEDGCEGLLETLEKEGRL
ncbi:MAG: low molecular weight phosphotyrosine protein phosphatase [Alistipes sp.]|nr:low molecular weight phosphotyrosine protein phosphatase [Alistipes sp.]MDE6508331.1 low molecular weight phosphotyrosine protein phosphatase [Alistipes sp.]